MTITNGMRKKSSVFFFYNENMWVKNGRVVIKQRRNFQKNNHFARKVCELVQTIIENFSGKRFFGKKRYEWRVYFWRFFFIFELKQAFQIGNIIAATRNIFYDFFSA